MISFESLHNFNATLAMKEVLKEKFYIIYIDTLLEYRVSRDAEELDVSEEISKPKVLSKDDDKISVGADKVKHVADVIINNNGKIDTLYMQINQFINEIRGGKL
ncbi:hypothetical protein D3C73_1268410 [compost metagenome]